MLKMLSGILDLGYILLNLSIVAVLVVQLRDPGYSANNQRNRHFAT